MRSPSLVILALAVLLLASSGCDEDEQQKALRSQAQLAEASRELVQADAKARGEVIALQRDLQQGQGELAGQRDQLENDRRQYADQRYRDPILASKILTVGIVLACLLPLALCMTLVLSLRDPAQTEATLAEILVEEIASEEPLLLPKMARQTALEQEPDQEDQPELPRADTA